jgi:hypothetical protein
MSNEDLDTSPATLDFFDKGAKRWLLAATSTAAEPATRLEFVVHEDSVELQQINVHPSQRGQHVALTLVRRVAERYPNKRVWFSGTNALSRRLARRCAQDISNFDADTATQEHHRADDETAGLYDTQHVNVLEWQINDMVANGMERDTAVMMAELA